MRHEGIIPPEHAHLDLRVESDVVDLMRSSRTEVDWHENSKLVLAANHKLFPDFWQKAIIKSGVAREFLQQVIRDEGTTKESLETTSETRPVSEEFDVRLEAARLEGVRTAIRMIKDGEAGY